MARARADRSDALDRPERRARLLAVIQNHRRSIGAIVREGQRAGQVRDDADPAATPRPATSSGSPASSR